jgi:hypothetical protein
MFNHFKDYSLFLKFLETYTPVGFQGIERNDPLMIEIEELMEENNQFFYIADIIQMKVLFTSNLHNRKRSTVPIYPIKKPVIKYILPIVSRVRRKLPGPLQMFLYTWYSCL